MSSRLKSKIDESREKLGIIEKSYTAVKPEEPSENEIMEYIKLEELKILKENARCIKSASERLMVIQNILAWSAFIVTLFSGLALLWEIYVCVTLENWIGLIASAAAAVMMFVLSFKAYNCREQ